MLLFGDLQILSFLSHVLDGYWLQVLDGYCGCGGSQGYHYGRCAVLKRLFVSPKVRLRRNKSMGKRVKITRVKKYIYSSKSSALFFL